MIFDLKPQEVVNGFQGAGIAGGDRDSTATLGFFHPMPKGSTVTPEGGWGPFTAEEVAAAFAQTGPGRPFEDILADLRKR